jgi:hypothetical protein
LRLACNTCSRQESRGCEQETTDGSSHDLSLLGGNSGFAAMGRTASAIPQSTTARDERQEKPDFSLKLKSALERRPKKIREPRFLSKFG